MSTYSTALRRITVGSVCVLSVVICCGLAWWQWERYASAGGTFQNLGYVLQWPLFGLFPLFMAWRMHRLRRQKQHQERGGGVTSESRASVQRSARPAVVQPSAPRTGPSADEDDELAAYNRYLAELNARDSKGT